MDMKATPWLADDTIARMTAWRRDLHAHPETAYQEHRTSDVVANALQAMGIEIHRGLAGTGVVGTLKNGDGPSIGLRADMDALDMTELGEKPYMSQNPGKMHGCGHDGHTSMLLGAAEYLAKHRNFRGTVHFIFQPAEENEGGGKKMIEEGLFDLFPCDSVYGMHNMPSMPEGVFGIRKGAIMACLDTFEVVITGKGTHAAQPERGIDPIVASSQLINALQTITSRRTSALDALVVTVTQIHGGDTWNVIPETVTLRGTVRSFDAKVRDRAEELFAKVCGGVADTTDTKIDVNYMRGYPATVNSPAEAILATEVATSLVGEDKVDPDCVPNMASEDFAFMLEAKPGAYVFLGAGKEPGKDAPLHNPYYDFNDDVLGLGARYWVALAERVLKA
jgi:amidohydrolase/hippurate hydrolase